MAVYIDEEEAWKCPTHPSRRRRTGICHKCLKQRLSSLCPDCANERPCQCSAFTSSSSGSSSSSYSRFSIAAGASDSRGGGVGSVGRVASMIESEPSFRRSRSLAVPFFRSKPLVDQDESIHKPSPKAASAFWSIFKNSGASKSRRVEVEGSGAVLEDDSRKKYEDEERRRMMRKSRSVAVTSDRVGGDVRSATKGKGWHFPSPMKVFRQSISRGITVDRSPLYRG